ncbi:complement factor H-related protein 4-like [Thunnus maccoyii]|uniref:complement factor H-related protein 4-like n=1 Tax=Thunnus maccoyii TaxID=8240 RepID=UPI001C4A9FC5|nr:complement factor H-related protein 4-like [Thunnus maccoyii]
MRFFHLLWLFILWLNMDKSLQQNEVTCSNQKHRDVYDWNVYWRQRITLDDTASYRCRSGYKKTDGADKLTCTRDGWSPDPPCQVPAGCERPPVLANGDTTTSAKPRYEHNERVEYICQQYYIMEGEPYQTCNNGEWTGEMKCLKPCTVDKELLEAHNLEIRHTRADKLYSAHDDVIGFQCVTGTRHDGRVGMRQKCYDGVMDLPTCH